MTPSYTAFTRMPWLAYSIASDFVAAAMPPLVSAVSVEGNVAVGVFYQSGCQADDVAAMALDEHLCDGALGEVEEAGRVHRGDM